MNARPKIIPPEGIDADTDWEALDSRVSTAVHEIQGALEEALAATRDLTEWMERLHGLSAFMQQVESGLAEVRHRLSEAPRAVRPVVVPLAVPGAEESRPLERASAGAETGEEPPAAPLETPEAEGGAEPPEAAAVAEQAAEPAGGGPPEEAPSAARVGGSVHLEIESAEANIDLMLVERALRETDGVADIDLQDYAGKRATVRVVLSEGERSEETSDPRRLASHVQERLVKLTSDGSLSVSVAE
jgi:hypothetical protein